MGGSGNRFKAALSQGQLQIGFWQSLGHSVSTEISAAAGFDWLLIDGEHGPNTLLTVRDQLLAVASTSTHPVVRISQASVAEVKLVMDVGAQTILVPMVDTAEDAALMARAMRYPPDGNRGNGANVVRASGYGRNKDYVFGANDNACLLVQVETATALENLDAICRVEGVSGVLIGPADLATSMGYMGQPESAPVQTAIEDAIARILKAGKAPGILMGNEALARRYIELGALFVAVGSDVAALVGATDALVAKYKGGQAKPEAVQVY